MVIKIQKNSINFNELVAYLKEQFPKYQFAIIGKNKLKIIRNKYIAAYITLAKNRVIIKGGFTSFKIYSVYVLFFLLLGIIVPLIITYLFIYPRTQMFLQEIADEVYSFYRSSVLNYSQYGRHDHK